MPESISSWLLIVPNVPTEPSRHRVAVWRELRRAGAVPVSSGTWTLPDLPGFTAGLLAAKDAAERGGGSVSVFTAVPKDDTDMAALVDAFVAARRDEWRELIADTAKFTAEVEREIAKEKFTFGELEEEEQSLDRLRRWQRDLLKRNAVPLPEVDDADTAIESATVALDRFAQLVYAANLAAAATE
ncbi:Chromate resistance protein ChrB [Microbacterium pumilum]|uniref:Chromate resistance protein ChrB n=1 Tax=Microbacterium pumilum TaxID=344165 RepID=UPI0031DB16B7